MESKEQKPETQPQSEELKKEDPLLKVLVDKTKKIVEEYQQ